jgi:tryptophan synthase alpha chain
MSRIRATFDDLKEKGHRGFIPFITAGDPDLQTTRNLLVELSKAGASIIELGVAFSDPMADGPVIQRASERALRVRFGIAEILEMVGDARKETDVPILLFSYFNPLLQYGIERLSSEAARAGVDGMLITDLVPEEAGDIPAILSRQGLDQVFLAAPTSTDDRLRLIAEYSTGFIYAVSRTGVTGARTRTSENARSLVARIRSVCDLPVAVGFGISSADQVAEVWSYAEGAVIGSAIVAEIERNIGEPDIVARVGEFARALVPEQAYAFEMVGDTLHDARYELL